MEKYGFLLGRLCYGCVLHCTSRFSSAGLLAISLIYRRFRFPLVGLVASVGFSSVSPRGVVKKPVVSFITSTWTEPLGFTPPSVVSLSHTNMTACDVSQYPSGFADLCLLILGMKQVRVIRSSTNSSACRTGAYSVHHLFLVFFQCPSRRNQLQRMKSALDLEGHLFHAEVSFCFLLSLW